MNTPATRMGRTGLMVSRLALGTMTFGLQTDEATACEILNKAASAGINFIDTADVYPLGGDLETVGRTEEILGRWLRGQRGRYIVATKAVGKMGPNAWDQGASRKHLLDAIDASLARLQTDYVDLFQLHSDDRTTPLEEMVEGLNHIVASGRARYVGVSNFLAYRLARLLGKAEAKNLVRIVTAQPRYSLLFREIERELLPLASEEGIGVIPYNPLAGGLLTGKHRAVSAPPPGTRFTLGSAAANYQQRYWNEGAFETVARFVEIARRIGISPTTLAIAWVLANPAITAPILGASKPSQLADSIAAASYQIDPAIKEELDQLTASYRLGDATR